MASAIAPVRPSLVGLTRTWHREPDANATLAQMRAIVDKQYELPALVEVAVSIAVTAPEKDATAQAAAILTWLRTYTHFVADPVRQQLLKVPTLMLALIQRDGVAGGDCVDIAMLSAALALAIGLEPVRFVGEGYAGDEVHAELVHVYTIVQTVPGSPGQWVNLDTQRTPRQAETHPVRRVEVDVPG